MLFVIIIIVAAACWFIVKANKNKTASISEIKERPRLGNKPIRTGDYQNTIYQSLESLYIIDNSSNTATVKSRLIFLHDLLVSCEFMICVNIKYYNSFWPKYVEDALMQYQQTYFDREVHEEVKKIILSPSQLLDNWNYFTESMLFNALERFTIVQQKFIDALKTNSAKNTRYVKIAEQIQVLLNDMPSAEFKDKYETLQKSVLAKIL